MKQPDTQPARTASGDEATSIAAFLCNGGRAVLLTGPSPCTTMLLAAALQDLPGPILRIANPLKAPLSLARLLLQVGGDPAVDDQAAGLSEAVRTAMDGKSSLVLSIADAHTMEPEALRALAHLVQTDDPTFKALRLVIEGRRELVDLLNAAGLDRSSSFETVMRVKIEGGTTRAPSVASTACQAQPGPSAAAVRSLRTADRTPLRGQPFLPLFEVGIATAMLAIAATFLLLLPGTEPEWPVINSPPVVAASVSNTSASLASSFTAGTMPTSELPPPPALAESELPEGKGEAQLRSNFRAFLARRGYTGQTREAQDALFEEYKEWLASNRSAQGGQRSFVRDVHVDRGHPDSRLN